jgi:uncharacterized membrane protein YoaK (UPF0700 family)
MSNRRLFALTATAGALDALSFLRLGKVFTSFQSGNVLFLGLGAGQGDYGLVVRAGVVLAAFFGGAVVGARVAGAALALETALLIAFAALWFVIVTPHEHPVAQAALLALAAAAMGVQGALVLELRIPNVVTIALTATVAYLGQLVGSAGRSEPVQPLLGALILIYVICALGVALLPAVPAVALLPLALLLAGQTSKRTTLPLRNSVT